MVTPAEAAWLAAWGGEAAAVSEAGLVQMQAALFPDLLEDRSGKYLAHAIPSIARLAQARRRWFEAQPLLGVACHVDARLDGGDGDASGAYAKLLADLGAKVVGRKDASVVVFHNGDAAACRKAREAGVAVVALSWVDACKAQLVRADVQQHLAQLPSPALGGKLSRKRKPTSQLPTKATGPDPQSPRFASSQLFPETARAVPAEPRAEGEAGGGAARGATPPGTALGERNASAERVRTFSHGKPTAQPPVGGDAVLALASEDEEEAAQARDLEAQEEAADAFAHGADEPAAKGACGAKPAKRAPKAAKAPAKPPGKAPVTKEQALKRKAAADAPAAPAGKAAAAAAQPPPAKRAARAPGEGGARAGGDEAATGEGGQGAAPAGRGRKAKAPPAERGAAGAATADAPAEEGADEAPAAAAQPKKRSGGKAAPSAAPAAKAAAQPKPVAAPAVPGALDGCALSLATSGLDCESAVLGVLEGFLKKPRFGALKGFRLNSEPGEVPPSTLTHVVTSRHAQPPVLRRTFKTAFALLRGVPVVSEEWVFRSLEAGAWLPHAPFVLAALPAAKRQPLSGVRLHLEDVGEADVRAVRRLLSEAGGKLVQPASANVVVARAPDSQAPPPGADSGDKLRVPLGWVFRTLFEGVQLSSAAAPAAAVGAVQGHTAAPPARAAAKGAPRAKAASAKPAAPRATTPAPRAAALAALEAKSAAKTAQKAAAPAAPAPKPDEASEDEDGEEEEADGVAATDEMETSAAADEAAGHSTAEPADASEGGSSDDDSEEY